MSHAKYGHTIAEFVRKFRDENDLSQGDLARMLGIHKQYVSEIERVTTNAKLPLMFCMRLRDVISVDRQKYLDVLISDAVDERIAQKMDLVKKKKKGKKKNG